MSQSIMTAPLAETMEKRRWERFHDSEQKITVNKKNGTLLRDVSVSGVSFYCDRRSLKAGDTVAVELFPPRGMIDNMFDSDCKVKAKVIGTRFDRTARQHYVAAEFDQDLQTHAGRAYGKRRAFALASIPLVILGIILMKAYNVTFFWYQPLINIYSIVVTAYIFSRFIFAYFYRPPQDVNYHPAISIIIPVKNDRDIIEQTIARCYESSYPQEQIEVIVINDGSTDDTLEKIYQAKDAYPRTQVVNFPVNRGKREAMAHGAKMAKGEVLVFIDSDSLVEDEALHYIVQGFADPDVGAVCGHANILNANDNLLTKMQEVRYFTAFKVIKGAEHIFSAVSCCSGCLSAYRRKYVMEIIDEWLGQTFLGTRATFGDDRSLTNYILKKYRVLYDSRAVVDTVAPANWKQFFTQQARWKKSWFRESLIAARFMWRKHPLASISYYLGLLFPIISPVVVFSVLLYKPVVYHTTPFSYAFGLVLVSLLYCLYYMLKRPNSKWFYGIYFCLLYVSVLSWQTYYSILTSRKNHWGTR